MFSFFFRFREKIFFKRKMSSPSSSFSSPCRRSPRLLSSAGSPVSSSACAGSIGPHRPNLNRRWSLDNLSSQREGYVRDLRRQHQRDRVEVKRAERFHRLKEMIDRMRFKFHQHFTCNFYACRSQKQKKYCQTVSSFCTFGICAWKSFA